MSRAIFEGMLGPDRKVIARGPFEVEVYEYDHARKTRWRACMIPTRFELKEGVSHNPHPAERKTESEMRIFVEFQFKKKIRDWHEEA